MPTPFRAPSRQPSAKHQRDAQSSGRIRAVDHAGEQDADEADRPGHREVEAAGQDHRALAQRQHGEERGQNEERVEVAGS